MNDNEWKQKSLTPVIIAENDDAYTTVTDLQNAIKKDDILNIALTGPFGSGKSSVLKTFIAKADSDTKILDISLATLDADESFDEQSEEDCSDAESNETKQRLKEILNRKIEFSILQQLVYRKALDTLPYSRLKKIRHFDYKSIRCVSALIVGFVLCMALMLKSSFFQIPVLYSFLRLPVADQNVIRIL